MSQMFQDMGSMITDKVTVDCGKTQMVDLYEIFRDLSKLE